MPTRDPHKRIAGIANELRRRFGLDWDRMDDLIGYGWVHYLTLAPIEDADWSMLQSRLRLDIIREIWGRVPHGGKVRAVRRPVYTDLDAEFMAPVNPESQLEARDILQRCIQTASSERARQTLHWLMRYGEDRGGPERIGVTARVYKRRKMELRRLFKERGLAV